jgi:hypothetical protein
MYTNALCKIKMSCTAALQECTVSNREEFRSSDVGNTHLKLGNISEKVRLLKLESPTLEEFGCEFGCIAVSAVEHSEGTCVFFGRLKDVDFVVGGHVRFCGFS